MSKKATTDPMDTRLRQVLTEILRDLDEEDELTAKDRAAIVENTLEDYERAIVDNMAGLLCLTMREMELEEDEDEKE